MKDRARHAPGRLGLFLFCLLLLAPVVQAWADDQAPAAFEYLSTKGLANAQTPLEKANAFLHIPYRPGRRH